MDASVENCAINYPLSYYKQNYKIRYSSQSFLPTILSFTCAAVNVFQNMQIGKKHLHSENSLVKIRDR